MIKVELDQYEKDILAAYEADEFVSVMTPERKKGIRQIAENTFKKDKQIGSWGELCESIRKLQ